MARIRTVNFLPEIFRTPANKQFLSATLDQLTQDPKLKRTQGFIGRDYGPGVNPKDNYIPEPSLSRWDYQLEPGVVYLKDNTNTALDAITYPGIVDSIKTQGGITTRQDRLWESQYYAFDPFVDYDMFVNYDQYYWLPEGPASVTVAPTLIPLSAEYDVTRTADGYTITTFEGTNPTITLARQGNYKFNVNQSGHKFWIQAAPGINGTMPGHPNQSSRAVYGVTNNGEDLGTVEFAVPDVNAQNFYNTLNNLGAVDLASTISYTDLQGALLLDVVNAGGIDGITDIVNRTVVFVNEAGVEAETIYKITIVGIDGFSTDGTTYGGGLFDATNYYIDLIPAPGMPSFQPLDAVNILYGATYGGLTCYRDAAGEFQIVPLITADLTRLYYQDSTNPDFFGVIKFVDVPTGQSIDIDEDILGHKTYTSPNGVTFTNGLKVQFEGDIVPTSYQGNEYYVEGVGSGIKLVPVSRLVTPEMYTVSGTIPYDTTPFDTTAFDGVLNTPLYPDYMVINRSDISYNAWSRCNRWFHIEVINATASYNKTTPVLDNNFRGRRPILEFRAGTRLFDNGTAAIEPVNVIDFSQTDALSNINGQPSYFIDGFMLLEGSRVIFAADVDPTVRNKVYEVLMIVPVGGTTPVIDLQPADIYSPDALLDQTVVCLNGLNQQGKSYWFDGVTWQLAQQKTSINQPPLFNAYDGNGVSFSDNEVYPGSTFKGTELFSYKLSSSSTVDTVLGLPLTYRTINNMGDIVFDNNLYTDTFIYVQDSRSLTTPISEGTIREYSTRTVYHSSLGWEASFQDVQSYQALLYTWKAIDTTLTLDVAVNSAYDVPVKLFINNVFQDPSTYSYVVTDTTTVITFNTAPAVDDMLYVMVISDQVSTVGYYTIPLNLENNPLNENVTELTLGTIRVHYGSICQNLKSFQGDINGQNNTRDLGNIVPYGQIILQQSAPLTFAASFLRDSQYDFNAAVDFNAFEYEKFKNVLMETVAKIDVFGKTIPEILDDCVIYMNVGKTQLSPFYWSDMLPSGAVFTETQYTYTAISTNRFDTHYTYDFAKPNYQGILVYLNDQILLGDGHQYEVPANSAYVLINQDLLSYGDVVTIREYPTTYGNFVPNTPTKMGMWAAYEPTMYYDETYVNPTWVIRGHDGSLTVAFSNGLDGNGNPLDTRDAVLLEFEKRIYNNLKPAHPPVPLPATDVIPGRFRKTQYTQEEVTDILGLSFLAWVGTNKLPYRVQDYIADNDWTWNYSDCADKITKETLLGNWRGIYQYFYDTEYPHLWPWEMLGISEKPDWWEAEYGPAPYTSGNLVLWDDLRDGLVRDPAGAYVKPAYVRPTLLDYIPVDSEGNLLAPYYTVVGQYDPGSFRKSWTVGDDGPVESAWRKSSTWPFMVQKLLSLTVPAKFFALNADIAYYNYNTQFNQYLYNDRDRLSPATLEVYGNGVAKDSYVNWIVDYNRQTGLDSTDTLTTRLRNIDVRLCYRMACFSDKSYLKIYTERASPNSSNNSLMIPDESYQLMLYQNPTIETVTWSSVIVQRTENGWALYGYDALNPYFNILQSVTNGKYITILVQGESVRVNQDHSLKVVTIPYGYEFTSRQAVVDFLISYGAYLENKGVTFETTDNTRILNWQQMAQEFLYWNGQGWGPGSLINLNPASIKLTIERPQAVVESLNSVRVNDILLNQNRNQLAPQDYVVERIDNKFTLQSVNRPTTINFMRARYTQYEQIIIFDNQSVFGDLIYNPLSGARQSRLMLDGFTTYDWTGTLDAQGFILNQDNVAPWVPNVTYTKGQIVKYKNDYWSAAKIIPPAEKFDFNVWIKSDYQQIQKGLLPNLATKAEMLRGDYNVEQVNLENDSSLLGYGLIGFRPRDYMAALNLDDVTQVGLYQEFIGSKGTILSAELFTNAVINQEVAQYQVYENWMIQRAVYGATASRAYFDVQMNQALLTSNPSTIQIVNPQEFSTADQQVLLKDLWKQSQIFPSTNILPTRYPIPTDKTLPSAGYVNINDAAITSFDYSTLDAAITDYLAATGTSRFKEGTSIWIAKISDYNWGIFRNTKVDGAVVLAVDNLNGTTTLTFTKPHNLTVGTRIIVRDLSSAVNGVYAVLQTPSITTLTIELSLPQQLTQIQGNGICFTLDTMRVGTPADIVNLPYADALTAGAEVWIDNIGDNTWGVYKKTEPFSSRTKNIEPFNPVTQEQFGAVVAQGFVPTVSFVSAPNYNSGEGAVYAFLPDKYGDLLQIAELRVNANGVQDFGRSITLGTNTWGAIGAPETLAGKGIATTIYRNESTAYTGLDQILFREPANLITTVSTGAAAYNVAALGVTDAAQIGVLVNNVENTNWVYAAPNVVFTTVPAAGAALEFFVRDEFGYSTAISVDERWLYVSSPGGNRVSAYTQVPVQDQVQNYVGDAVTYQFPAPNIVVDATDIFLASTQVIVSVEGFVKTPNVDYQFIDGAVAFVTPPGIGEKIYIARNQISNQHATATQSIFDISNLFTATTTESVDVYVNYRELRPFVDYVVNPVNKTLVLTTPVTNAVVIAYSGSYFEYVDEVVVSGLANNARFGQSIATNNDGSQLFVGAPNVDINGLDSVGTTYFFGRTVEAFTVTNTATTQYTTSQVAQGTPTVKLNGVILVADNGFNNNGVYTTQTVTGGTQVTLNVPLNIGDVIEVGTNQLNLVQTLNNTEPTRVMQYGWTVDVSQNSCSLFVGKPGDCTTMPEAGSVDRLINIPQMFGTVTSTVENPTLTPGGTIRVNNYYVELTQPANWYAGTTWAANTFVLVGSDLYKSKQAVPVGMDISSTVYWEPATWVEAMAQDINNAGIVNVAASTDINGYYLTVHVVNRDAALIFRELEVMPGTGTLFGELGFDVLEFNQTIRSPNEVPYAHFGYSLHAADNNTTLVVGAPNGEAMQPTTFDKDTTTFDYDTTNFYNILSESGVAFTYDLVGVDPRGELSSQSQFVFGQQLYDKKMYQDEQFGISVNYTGSRLLVGIIPDPANQLLDDSGRVCEFSNPTLSPAWVPQHIQQPEVNVDLINSIYAYDKLINKATEFLDFIDPLQGKILGVARENLDYIGPQDPAAYNTGNINNSGQMWTQAHVGEIWWDLSTVRFTEYHQGSLQFSSKTWGSVFPGSSVDVYQWIVSPFPPSEYVANGGQGTPYSTTSYVTSAELNSDDNLFSAEYFFWVKGITETIPGKSLSPVAIAQYIENPRSSGIPYAAALRSNAIALYNMVGSVSAQDTILSVEFDIIPNNDNIHTEYDIITAEDPFSFLSTTLYRKFLDSWVGQDTAGNPVPDPALRPADKYGVLYRPRQSVFVDRFAALKNYLTAANRTMAEFPIAEARSFSLLNSAEPVPQPTAGTSSIGIVNTASSGSFTVTDNLSQILIVGDYINFDHLGVRSTAFQVVAVAWNGAYTSVAVTPTFDAAGFTPQSGDTVYKVETNWNREVATYAELMYQDIYVVPVGFKYLVLSDETQTGLWTIYTVESITPTVRELKLSRVQSYDTPRFWSYVNWVKPGYNANVKPVAEVAMYADLATLTVYNGESVKVNKNSFGKYEIYQYDAVNATWERVVLEDGTIAVNETIWNYDAGRYGFDVEVFDVQRFDEAPLIETRNILEAINTQILVGDLAIFRNALLIGVFEYILAEQLAPEWLFKTSFIDVDHRISSLEPYQFYRPHNQDFVVDYIKEVKPYHDRIRELNLLYDGMDTYQGTMTDFDVPAYYDTQYSQYVSPILNNSTSDFYSKDGVSDRTSAWPQWQNLPYSQWFQNYLISIESVTIADAGSGYLEPPLITVVNASDFTELPEFVTYINANGTLRQVVVVNPGSAVATTPVLSIEGNARIVPVMGNGKVRSMLTVVNFNRCEYSSTVTDWKSYTNYNAGDLVRYAAKVYSANSSFNSGSLFNPDQYTVVPAENLSAADRVMGMYIPGPNEPGVRLELVMSGITYPGVQVYGPAYSASSGYGLNPYDTNVYDDISYLPDGRPTYAPETIDAMYESSYLDTYLGTRPDDVNVDGGAYIDTWESYAPEELVPGAIFDTLDYRVYQRPGGDPQTAGFPQGQARAFLDTGWEDVSFASLVQVPYSFAVTNADTGVVLKEGVDYAISWTSLKIGFENSALAGSNVLIEAFGLGGGAQLFKELYRGSDIQANTIVPVPYADIYEIAAMADGVMIPATDYTISAYDDYSSEIVFTSLSGESALCLTVLGVATPQYSYSYPVTEVFTSMGSATLTLANYTGGTNAVNAVVNVNGERLRPAEAAAYIGDAATTTYDLPNNAGTNQSAIVGSEVLVYVNNVLSTGYVLNPYVAGTPRSITFSIPPASGAEILVAVTTDAAYTISGNVITFKTVPAIGATVSVTTFNDTSEQDLITQVWQGPAPVNVTVSQGYGTTRYSTANTNNTPGSYDYSASVIVYKNEYNLDATGSVQITDPDRMWVTVNGIRWFAVSGGTPTAGYYTVVDNVLTLGGPLLSNTDIVAITTYSEYATPDDIAFRVFDDMLGSQVLYRIIPEASTTLTADMTATDDIAYVFDASKLPVPDLPAGIFGSIIIDGERILYRDVDLALNTISGLRRGVSGTGADSHTAGAIITSVDFQQALPPQYQQHARGQDFMGDGTTTTFTCSLLTIDVPVAVQNRAVRVNVGGTMLESGFTVNSQNTVSVTLDTAPAAGVEVSVYVVQAHVMYAPGPGTASNGLTLSAQTTPAVEFIKGVV